ncbi:tropomyosin-like [Nicotiana tomentosiformis]|uniref:tropomyosin-like n=1 Tax=Nicotiana tomentosiformis TaxID=4098 RepID=UPI00388C5E2E
MNKIQDMTNGWKSKMDFLGSKKEIAHANLKSVEVQLRVAKEKADKRDQLNEDLRAQLSSVVTEWDALGREHEAMKSKLETTSADAKEMVAQYKADVEAAEALLKTNAKYVRRLS